MRIRHTMSPEKLVLLAVGTTSNESLHAEIKNWFRTIQMMHQSTLQLKLLILTLRKQIPHVAALLHPTLRQMAANIVLSTAVSKSVWSNAEWLRWCATLHGTEGQLHKAEVPLRDRRREEAAQVREWVLKRPACSRKRPASSIKRTPFTLERRDNLVRAGVKHTAYKQGWGGAGTKRSSMGSSSESKKRAGQ